MKSINIKLTLVLILSALHAYAGEAEDYQESINTLQSLVPPPPKLGKEKQKTGEDADKVATDAGNASVDTDDKPATKTTQIPQQP